MPPPADHRLEMKHTDAVVHTLSLPLFRVSCGTESLPRINLPHHHHHRYHYHTVWPPFPLFSRGYPIRLNPLFFIASVKGWSSPGGAPFYFILKRPSLSATFAVTATTNPKLPQHPVPAYLATRWRDSALRGGGGGSLALL